MRSDFPSFDGRDVEWCWSHYLARAEDGENALASPLLADLRGLPPALIVTAEHDPLRDEGELYAEKLRQSGVDVEVVRIAGAAHGFFSGTDERTTSAQRLVAAALGRAFGARRDDRPPARLPGRPPARYRHRRVRADREERAPAGVRSVRLRDRRRLRRSTRGNGGLGQHVFRSLDELLDDPRSRSSTSRPIPTSASS